MSLNTHKQLSGPLDFTLWRKTESRWVYPPPSPCHTVCNKSVYPEFQIDGSGNGVSCVTSYHSYSINTNCTQKLWHTVLVVSTQMTDGMEGLASAGPYSRRGFSGYTHARSILPQRPVAQYRYIIQRPNIIAAYSSHFLSLFLSMCSAGRLWVITSPWKCKLNCIVLENQVLNMFLLSVPKFSKL